MPDTTPALWVEELVSQPSTRVAHFAVAGTAIGAALAAVIGLAGEAIGPGNRTAVLSLLAIPVAGAVVGVLWAGNKYR